MDVAEYLCPTCFFYKNVNNSAYFFGCFITALEEESFSYGQEGDLLLNKIQAFPLLATVLLKTKLSQHCVCVFVCPRVCMRTRACIIILDDFKLAL